MESRKAQNSKQLRWQIPELSPLDRHSATWAHLKKRFLSIGWQHPHKPMPRVRAILKISHQEDALEKFFLYRDEVDAEIGVRTDPPGNTKLRFHGTAVRCLLGETPRHCKPCSHPSCSLCSIIKASFCVAKCGSRHQFQRFGRGVYTTKCSSKADDYIINYLPERQTRVMIVAEVVLGKTLRLERNAEYLSEPPFGFHSVVGVPGQALHYQENVVYSDNAIRPAFLIIYEAPQGAPAASSSQNSSEVSLALAGNPTSNY